MGVSFVTFLGMSLLLLMAVETAMLMGDWFARSSYDERSESHGR